MAANPDTAHVLDWLGACTERFLATVSRLDGSAWDEPSLLPGWRRREVVAHVHHNAEGLGRLVTWARTGVETPMYASWEQRQADIGRTAELPEDELRRLVHDSAAAFATDLEGLTSEHDEQQVRLGSGRPVRAAEIPWLRCKEVAIHGIDLDADLRFDDLPDGLAAAIVRDVVEFRLERGEAPTLATWLTGRGVAGEELGPWI